MTTEPTDQEHGHQGQGDSPKEILIFGDLHGQFDDGDLAFVEERQPELVLFLGDLGDEDPAIAREVRKIQAPFRILLGNHDAWESFRHDEITDRLAELLGIVGEENIAYRLEEWPEFGLSLLGARPFSWGGPSLRSPAVYEELYGIKTLEDSSDTLIAAASEAQAPILVLAHNGPKGLGSQPGDIYGKDFGKPGGDWGDRDLQVAIKTLKEQGKEIPLVVAGHMHHRLAYPRGMERRLIAEYKGTFYTNPARVPRIFESDSGETLRHYLSIRVEDGEILRLDQLLVSEDEVRRQDLFARLSSEEV